ncbi:MULTISPECIES: carbohydrate ABC transporter permease [unclassified Streptomyces]|uniref:carbohydrate ABC transporter permease n=1 Tax=unclassified Streptomyces TaxID=2593676 RepID=UPI0035D74BEF
MTQVSLPSQTRNPAVDRPPASDPGDGAALGTLHRIPGLARHLTLAVLAAISLFPCYYLLVNSLKSRGRFADSQWDLPLSDLRWDNYGRAWDVVARPLLNSIVVVGVSVLAILALAALTAYAFSVIRFPGHRIAYALTFVLLMVPSFLLLLPLYLQISNLPAIKTNLSGIILPSVAANLSFAVVVLKSAFDDLPRDVVDSARIDGAGELRILWSIVLPLCRPVLASVSIIQFVALWNDYLLPQLVLAPQDRTVSVALVAFTGNPGQNSSPDFGPLMAGYVLAAVPLILLFSVLMRAYIEGLTSGATKL